MKAFYIIGFIVLAVVVLLGSGYAAWLVSDNESIKEQNGDNEAKKVEMKGAEIKEAEIKEAEIKVTSEGEVEVPEVMQECNVDDVCAIVPGACGNCGYQAVRADYLDKYMPQLGEQCKGKSSELECDTVLKEGAGAKCVEGKCEIVVPE